MSEIKWYTYEANWYNEYSSEDLGADQDVKGILCAEDYCDAVRRIVATYGEDRLNNLKVAQLFDGYVYELSDAAYEKIKEDEKLNYC